MTVLKFTEEYHILELSIHPQLRDIIPPLDDETFEKLEKNILKNGCLDAIKTWKGYILDGHNRYKICSHHKVSFKQIDMGFIIKDEPSALLWIIDNQLERRNLEGWQVFELKKERVKTQGFTSNQHTDNSQTTEDHDTTAGPYGPAKSYSTTGVYREDKDKPHREEAQALGMGHTTYSKCKHIDKNASEEQKQKLRKGEATINSTYKEINQEEAKKKTAFPDGKFDLVFAEPFERTDSGIGWRPIKPLHELSLLPVKDSLADEAGLAVLIPSPYLKEMLGVVTDWGFRYDNMFLVNNHTDDCHMSVMVTAYKKHFGWGNLFWPLRASTRQADNSKGLKSCLSTQCKSHSKLSLFSEIEGWENYQPLNRRIV
jgi:hypothetical protein